LLLTLSFIATALTLRLTFHADDVFRQNGSLIEENLHKQEQFVEAYISNPINFSRFRTIHQDSAFALHLLDLRKEKTVFFFTYLDHKLLYWGTNRITPKTDAGLKEGTSFVSWKNGWYEAIKRTEGNFSVVCYIPVKAKYPIQNTYLVNVFSPVLTTSDNLDIAGLNDDNTYNIRSSVDGRYLFSLKLKPTLARSYYSDLELFTWIVSIILTCFLFNSVCLWIAGKGYVKTAILLLAAFFVSARILALHQNWFILHFNLPVFDPKYYGAGPVYPSIGDLLLNVLAFTWWILFVFKLRDRIFTTTPSRCPTWLRIAVFAFLCTLFAITLVHVDDTFKSLIINSSINFDVNNILNLSPFSWLGIFILCIGALNLYLLLLSILTVIKNLHLFVYYRFLVPAAVAAALLLSMAISGMTMHALLLLLILLSCGWMVIKNGALFNPAIFAVNLILFAALCSLKLSDYRFAKDRESRKVLAQTLEMSDDPDAVLYFNALEQKIVADDAVISYFKGPDRDYAQLKNRLQQFYFDDYLTRYELTIHQFDANGSPIDGNSSDELNHFRELVVAGTIKVTRFFYRVNNTFGTRYFFALLPISENGNELGTLVIELKSGTFESPDAFPRVLADVKLDETEKIRNYSFAFYKDGILVNQYGNYPYKVDSEDYIKGKGTYYFLNKHTYDHLVYRPNSRNLIVVSSSIPGIIMRFGSVSFLFLVLLFFSVLCAAINWVWKNLVVYQPGAISRWEYLTQGGHILYKTRIQVSIVLSVILTLVVVGLVTYFNIINQYARQQEQSVSGRLEKIANAFEQLLLEDDTIILSNEQFTGFADVNTADLTYYNETGKVYYTTQPKIYDAGLISPMMNTRAYIYMHQERHSEYINTEERIGRMTFIAAYRPVQNSKHETIGYLSLPYFSNQHELGLRIGEFLNSMVNVYALVLVSIGFFAVFMANQITNPLTIIQKNLSQIKIGTHNTPISWKRNDEIGSLIREYNTMIAELEESAARLARSERETAWKEMAKQVAHEIKNPLTPLKLGVQLLDKSWREKDPNFNKKFERFSKSFIEQIESLAHIASEFSNFAKMPETSLENVVLRDVIEQSIEVYSKLDHVTISFDDRMGHDHRVNGDRDQLLRSFNNLIKNATEAIPASRPGLIRITAEERDNMAHITLSDNGKGIPDGLKERIFNPNFTTKSSGTGLGLAFVKQAIENMAGSIRFTTEPNEGTTFYIRLPLAT
jgi:signal transduction histidine kinase